MYECKTCKKERDYKSRVDSRSFLIEFKKKSACVDCGNNDWRVLQFDHVGKKRGNLSEMANGGFAISSLIREIEECVIRCANCHQIKTWHQKSTL